MVYLYFSTFPSFPPILTKNPEYCWGEGDYAKKFTKMLFWYFCLLLFYYSLQLLQSHIYLCLLAFFRNTKGKTEKTKKNTQKNWEKFC